MIKIITVLLCIFAFSASAQSQVNNILIYGEGDVQVTSDLDEYQTLLPGVPIQGTIMITHTEDNKVDPSSFSLGDKPLKVEFVQSVPMTDYGSFVVSIYKFTLDGKAKGVYTLPPIQVKVGDKYYRAAPLVIQVNPA